MRDAGSPEMETIYIEEKQLLKALRRNQAFWKREIEEGPLMWVTAPGAKPTRPVPEPGSEEELWTSVDYVIAANERALCGTHYAGDALPVFCPWLGPDQFAGWLGAELLLRPRQSTSWSKPFVEDWEEHAELRAAQAGELRVRQQRPGRRKNDQRDALQQAAEIHSQDGFALATRCATAHGEIHL